jgi:hypothetical protein
MAGENLSHFQSMKGRNKMKWRGQIIAATWLVATALCLGLFVTRADAEETI